VTLLSDILFTARCTS